MSDFKKEKIGNLQSVNTQKGSFEKLSIELNKIGNVIEKNGKVYIEMDANADGLNPYSKDGETRYFFNMIINTYRSLTVDAWKPNGGGGGNTGGQSSSGGGDDLPF